MNTTQKSPKWTDRPAPLLPGLYSLQAVTNSASSPDVTVYRMSVDAAERYMKRLLKSGKFDCFLLRYSVTVWYVYDRDGIFVEKSNDPVGAGHIGEVEVPTTVDRADMLDEARKITGHQNLSLISCAENHSGASAVDHSNFVVVCRRMILDAKPEDLQHLYIVDSKKWDCRVLGVYADVAKLSAEMQDVFLERYRWLEKGWPLIARHHMETLADRLTKCRSKYVSDTLEECGRAAGMSQESILGMKSAWMLASPGSKYKFAQQISTVLSEGLLYAPGKAELFDPAVIESKGGRAVEGWRLTLSR